MKKMTNLWSIALIVLTMSACQKSEITENQNPAEMQSKKPGAVVNTSVTYSGQAAGVNAIVVNTQNYLVTSQQSIIGQTEFLPTAGGTKTAGAVQALIPGVLTADSISASTTGQGSAVNSAAFLSNLVVTIGGNTITADIVQSSVSIACGTAANGNSRFENLVINGIPVTVSGNPNQFVHLPNGGLVIINERSTSQKKGISSVTGNALHVILPNGSTLKIGSTTGGVKC